jgi:hypothetical protein
MNNRRLRWLLISMSLCALASCATQPPAQTADAPGFFSGLWHGFIILFSFIGSLFMDHRIYAFPNSGGWYDFGFLIGASAALGASGAAAGS